MFFSLLSRLRGLFTSRAQDEELAREVRDHIELLAAEFERRGMNPTEARTAALRQFGGVTHLQDELHDKRSLPLIETLLRDFRYSFRGLGKSPLFAVTAILTLALGIGANTAIFSVTDQALLRALPVRNPHQLVHFDWDGSFLGGSMRGRDSFSYPAYRDLSDGNPGVFTGIAARYMDSVDVADHGAATRAFAELVSGNYFQVLGVSSAIGRTLTPADDTVTDASPVVVLSYEYWTRRFGADPAVLNRTIDVNGRPMTVIGVAQSGFPGFASMSPADLFVPMSMKMVVTPTWDDRDRRSSAWVKVFGRLSPGVPPKTALAAMAIAYRRSLENDLAAEHRSASFGTRYLAGSLKLTIADKGYDQLQQSFAKPLFVMLTMVGTLLLITCVNVANLLVSRAASRQKEIAIRVSLGASRFALVRLILIESLTLSLAGGALGLALAVWISRLLVRFMPYDNIAAAFRTAPDVRVLAFTAALSMTAALLFGLIPALQGTGPISPSLKGHGNRLHQCLVAAQVALSLLLLVGAGLFSRSLQKLMSVDRGIDTAHILSFHTDPSLHRYSAAASRQFVLDLQARLASIPGVVAAGGATVPILARDNWVNGLHVEGDQPRSDAEGTIGWNAVGPGFFIALGVPLVAGRDFSPRDVGDHSTVAIVNESFARKFSRNGHIVGLHLGFGSSGPTPIEIIGVVRDMKNTDVTEDPRPYHYTALLQESFPEVMIYVRTQGEPLTYVAAIRRELARIDPSLPMLDVQTLESRIGQTHYLKRLFAWLSAAFGLLATLLASIGLYGVTAFAVARRTREIGIRMALGAGRATVLRMVMREVLLLTVAGVAIGLPVALVLSRYLESQLYQLSARDPLVAAAATLIIVAVSTLAGYLPARRAARIDPLRALRYE